MATKLKKQTVKAPVKKPVSSKKESTFTFSTSDIIPLVLIFLYLVVDFVPNFGSADVMGAQWVYIVIVNFLSAGYIFWDRRNSSEAITAVSKNILTILFTSLFVLAAISILAAMNKIETLVTMARFAATIVAFFSMAILLYKRQHLFKYAAQILSIFLLIQSANILNQFFTGLGTIGFNELIDSLKGNAANKNIMAASLVIKMAFASYCMYTFKNIGKIFNLIILTLAAMAVFFINARASFVSLIVISVLYLSYTFYEYYFHKKKQELLMNLGTFFLPLIFASVLSQIVVSNHLELDEANNNQVVYGSITERLSTINMEKEKSGRLMLWGFAIQTLKENPILGVGYGNYKLALIPYERTFSDEMFTTYHAHNDFLEIAAETGILGGLLYISLYLAMTFLTYKVITSNASIERKRISAFSLIAFSVYFIDAVFNFPVERPIMQIFLVSIMAFNLSSYLNSRDKNLSNTVKWTRPVYVLLALLIMIPTLYITHSTYRSMVAQNKYNSDFLTASPVYKAEEVVPRLPSIPNLNVFSFPIDAIKARYYLAEKKYDQALALLNSSSKVNPYITYNEFLKGNLFLEINQLDSASFYAEKAFFMKPRARSNYLLLNVVVAQTKDSVLATKAFNEAVKYKNEAWKWNEYINLMFNLGKSYKFLYTIADSAAKQFPGDPELMKKQQDLYHWQDQPR